MQAVGEYFSKKIKISLPRKTFKERYTFQKRYDEATSIMRKYPDRVPIICEKIGDDPSVPDIDRKKYLVPNDLGVAQFMYVIRKRMKLSSEKSIYLFIDDMVMPPTSCLIHELYYKYKDDDGFLYISYSGENTFG